MGATHDAALEDVKQSIAQTVKIVHPKLSHELYLFTAALETHWAAVLTQVPKGQLKILLHAQKQEPLSFLSGDFEVHAERWGIEEKEAFAVVEGIKRLDYIIVALEVYIFTDHANSPYIFDLYGNNPGTKRPVANKLMRWALRLSASKYVMEFIPGENNLWADNVTRWESRSSTRAAHVEMPVIIHALIEMGRAELEWPPMAELKKCQIGTVDNLLEGMVTGDSLLQDGMGRVWISDERKGRLRLLIAVHAGRNVHKE